jgi:4-amino-4-deoxy-L-arabinose transferase-like glycosyltransferase
LKDLYNKEIAILTSFILAVFPTHIYLSRFAFEFILVSFFIVLSLYLLLEYCKTKRKKFFYMFFLASGLGVISRLNFLFFLVFLVLASVFYPLVKISNLKNKIKTLTIAILMFLLGVYPLILFNVRNNFPILGFLNKFPITHGGENLLDIKNNLLLGLYNFYRFMSENCFPIFIFSVITLVGITIFKKYSNIDTIFLRKDIFMTIIFIGIFFLSATLTLNAFGTKDYSILMTPFIVLFMGRAFYEILDVFKTKLFYYFLLLLIIFIFIYYLYLDYDIILNFKQLENLDEKNYFDCVMYAEDVVKYINNSKVFTDRFFALKWYAYMKKLPTENILAFNKTNLKKSALYIFGSKDCYLHDIQRKPPVSEFLDLVNQQNMGVVLEKEIRSSSGEVFYMIYRLT